MSVRVRIAPSPTGDPHVGTAYIAMLNYCFARKHGGQFVLRIEDTDQTRCTDSSKEAIMHCLRWLGMPYDEGPDVGGDQGPYVQSERVAAGIYSKYAEQLVEQGDAYYCFATARELEAMRNRQRQNNEPIMYDRRYRGLDPAEAKQRVEAGEEHVIRMKAPAEGEHVYHDRLRKAPVVKAWKEIDDQVLLKADGWPTYHLAAVVDDHLMGITHVIRAEEWLNSLPKHTWLNEKLGFDAPEYIHVGLLRNSDKSKISKRKNPTNVLWYRDQGFLPEALVNFLANLGHSHPDGLEKYPLDELVRVFDIDRLSVAGPVFDLQKLKHLQGQYLREMSDEDLKASIHKSIDYRLDDLLPLLRERMTFGGDFTWLAAPFFADTVDHDLNKLIPKGWDAAQTASALEGFQSQLKKALKKNDFSWSAEGIEGLVRQYAQEHELKPRQFFMSLRVAFSGSGQTPPLFDTIAQIGQVKGLERLSTAIMKLRSAQT